MLAVWVRGNRLRGLVAAFILIAGSWATAGLTEAAGPPAPDHGEPAPNGLCLICHGAPGLTTESGPAAERTVEAIDPLVFAESAHGEEACTECHAPQAALPHPRATGPALGSTAACASCHEEAYSGYLESPHGTMAKLEDARGPTCAECHGSAHALPSIAAWSKEDRAGTCAGCHPGASTRFLNALSHEEPSPSVLPLAYFAGRFLVVLASGALAFGIIHVELDLLRWVVRRLRPETGRRERWEST